MCSVCGLYKDKKWEWRSPPFGLLKVYVMGQLEASRVQLVWVEFVAIMNVICYLLFQIPFALKDSSEAQILTILEVMRSFKSSYHDSMSLLFWKVILLIPFLGFQVQLGAVGMFPFFFFLIYINEIKFLSSSMDVEIRHILSRLNE